MMALDNNYFLFPQQPLLDWDPEYSFGFEEFHDLHNSLTEMKSPMSLSEGSTGYLEDAVAQWSDRCKRRRLDSSPQDPVLLMTEDLFQGFWNSNFHGDILGNFNSFLEDDSTISGDSNLQNCSPPLQLALLSPPSSAKEPITTDQNSNKRDNYISKEHSITTLDQEERNKKKNMKKVKIVYPFAVLKPVGLEGDVTLADINKRILMRPTRPVKHPVGKFATGSAVSADGPGLSGKAVVGLTRIHTRGRGTITIIRTRG